MEITVNIDGNFLTRLKNEEKATNRNIDTIINNAIELYIMVSALESRNIIDIEDLYIKNVKM